MHRDKHSAELEREQGFPLYQAITFIVCAVLFAWCATAAEVSDTARGNTQTMDTAAEAVRRLHVTETDAKLRRLCRGKPLAVYRCRTKNQ